MLSAVGALGAASLLPGCSLLRDRADPPPPAPPDPLEPLLAGVDELITQYQQARRSHPERADLWEPIEAAHRAHRDALREAMGLPALPTASPADGTPPPGTPGTPRPPEPTPAADPVPGAELREALREAEQAAQEQAAQACLSAPPERAALLGSVTAARATHQEVLT